MRTWLWAGIAGCVDVSPKIVEAEPVPEPPAECRVAADEAPTPPDGRALFARTWVEDDPRSRAGDGLGPVFNADSCASCHSQGGLGGAGGTERNVAPPVSRFQRLFQALSTRPISLDTGFLMDGDVMDFREIRDSTVIPTFVPSPGLNPPPLFGDGLLSGISTEAIEAGAATSWPDTPKITGRVGKDEAGQVARFGWKAQVADLPAFVTRACARELGLEVPGEHQPMPLGAVAKGLDLDAAQVGALTDYVAALPPPDEATDQPGRDHGSEVFDRIGCSDCHRPDLGGVSGIYSDLLLHDLGPSLGGSSFYGFAPSRDSVATVAADAPAAAGEWRTPPLWGVASSGPWLHDGRADTLDSAIESHGGEAAKVTDRYDALPAADRADLQSFLQSLVAPGS